MGDMSEEIWNILRPYFKKEDGREEREELEKREKRDPLKEREFLEERNPIEERESLEQREFIEEREFLEERKGLKSAGGARAPRAEGGVQKSRDIPGWNENLEEFISHFPPRDLLEEAIAKREETPKEESHASKEGGQSPKDEEEQQHQSDSGDVHRGKDKVIQIPLRNIEVDLGQVRQVIPRSLLSLNDDDPYTVIQEIKRQAPGSPLLSLALKSIVELANDILANGLINPISVYRKDKESYGLICGERRYWAFVYLASEGHKQYERIDAVCVVPPSSDDPYWRMKLQVAENMSRLDIPVARMAQICHQVYSSEMANFKAESSSYEQIKQIEQQVVANTVKTLSMVTGRKFSTIVVRDLIYIGQRMSEEGLRIAAYLNLDTATLKRLAGMLPEGQSRQLELLLAERSKDGAEDRNGAILAQTEKKKTDEPAVYRRVSKNISGSLSSLERLKRDIQRGLLPKPETRDTMLEGIRALRKLLDDVEDMLVTRR